MTREEQVMMKKAFPSSSSTSKDDKDDSSVEDDDDDPLLDDVEVDALNRRRDFSTGLNASTPCLTESRPSSSMGPGYEWENPWSANSVGCLVTSSSRASPMTVTSCQGVSPDEIHDDVFLFRSNDTKTDRSLCSMTDALQTEKDFMDYVMSFPLDLSNIHHACYADHKKSSADASPKVGLDHLDNLCKLMEQLSDLKEANVKLKKRVQYLEDLKTLHEIHREMMSGTTMCNSGISEDEIPIEERKNELSQNDSEEKSDHSKEGDDFREFVTKLYRSKTTTHVDSRQEQKRDVAHRSRNDAKGKARERSKSVGHPGHPKCKKRSSRWSKVKEVLGIEKTDSGANDERETVYGEENENSEEDCSSHVLVDRYGMDSKRSKHKESTGRPHSTALLSQNCPKSNEHLEACKKSPKTPWGKMKTMIQSRRDCRTQKSESSSSSSKGLRLDNKANNDKYEPSDKNGNRRSTRPRKTSFTLQDAAKRYQYDEKLLPLHNDRSPTQICVQKSPSRQLIRRESTEKGSRFRPAINSQLREDAKSISTNNERYPKEEEECPCRAIDKPMKKADTTSAQLQERLLPNKASFVLQEPKTCSQEHLNGSPSSPQEDEAGRGLADSSSFPVSNEKGGAPSTQSLHPCASAAVTELLKELQQNLSDDFNRKLEEWQRFRGESGKLPGVDVERKESFGRFRKFSKPEKKGCAGGEKSNKAQLAGQKKNLNWLDKELPKIEREILRLSKEKQKFEERAFHLRRLKEALTESQNKNEVLIKTSAGEFRFEGISNAFTKKLYEWETRKGVRPELSTIALLDESLKPHEDLPQTIESRASEKLSGTGSVDQTIYQKSRASSEPDLSTLAIAKMESNGALTALRSKSGDTLLATSNESSLCRSRTKLANEALEAAAAKPSETATFAHSEDSYYSLLEENIFLLDQLKNKEDICFRLQNELDRLDEKFDKANKAHQDELENSRRKLWEIHMSRPRDLQGSLQLISELKTRIEELESCSDKLKCDREKLEESFKYHSEQQRRLADDLMRRIKDLQQSGFAGVLNRLGCSKQWKKVDNDVGNIDRIHEISTKLLQQARDMQSALAERTRQVCHLRWELLHRDMSAVLLQAALHRVTCQGPQAALLPTWNMKRIQFKELKAWSIDTTTRRQSENTIAEDWLQERLKQLSLAPYNEWTSIEFNPNDLMTTVHELKKEAFQMSACQTDLIPDARERKKTTSCSAESETADSDRNYDTGSAFNSRSSSLSSGHCGLRCSHSDTRLYERSRSLSMRRNSSSSMSCVSGFDASESSSLHDSDKIHQHFLKRGNISWNRKKKNRWPSRENVSSSCSSHSSGLDDENIWNHEKEDAADYDETVVRRLKYESLREADEENADAADQVASGSDYLISPKPMTIGLCSSGRDGPTYSLLKSLISHPSYTQVVNSNRSSPESVVSNDVLKKFQQSKVCDSEKQHGEASKSNESNLPFSIDHDNPDVADQNSSTYTSLESLDNCNYVTHKEQQLFLDIRNLAISCETDITASESSATITSQIADKEEISPATRSVTTQYDSSCKPVNIAQIKYKGTKGFGKTSKIDFRRYETKNIVPK